MGPGTSCIAARKMSMNVAAVAQMFMNMLEGSAVSSSPSQLIRTPMPTKFKAALMNPSGRNSHMKMSVVTTLDATHGRYHAIRKNRRQGSFWLRMAAMTRPMNVCDGTTTAVYVATLRSAWINVWSDQAFL